MTLGNELSSTYPIFVSSIPSSSLGEKLVWTHIDKPIGYVETLMLLHKYNQIPVFDHDEPWSKYLRGIVTWRSIARARLGRREPSLAEALVENQHVVDKDLDLFTAIPRILDTEIVLVRDKGRIDGLVTLYDLTEYLAESSEPFFLLSEIEVLLRRLVERCTDKYTPGQRGEADISIKTLDDLGMGDCRTILEQQNNWELLGTNQDRATVTGEIECARKLRNQLMHGRPFEMDDIGRHRNLLDYLRILAQPPRNWQVTAKNE
ncbi:CBS domain-containing protein [Candidatus Poriferisodalis sp.]|uniref:CBS domain-containing protein n=1 Tax=Candidatus Poriferisodalis sp. TaxID=3101277 RepID=UPI003AF79B92